MKPLRDASSLPVILVVMILVQALTTMSVLAIATLAPDVGDALGLGAHLVGYQVSAIYVAATLTSGFANALVRKSGASRTSQLALLMSALGCVGLAVGVPAVMLLASLFIGVGYGLTNPAASHLMVRFTPTSRRNLVFSLKQTAVPIGGVMAGLMLPPIAAAASWEVATLAVAGLAVLLSVAMQPLRTAWDNDREPDMVLRAELTAGPRLVWRHGPLRYLALTGFCFAAVQICLMSFLVDLLVEDFSYSLVQAGFFVSVVQGSGVAGRILWGGVADHVRSGLRVLMTIGLISGACALLTGEMTAAWGHWLSGALLALFGMSAIGWNGVFLAEIARFSPPGKVSGATGGALFFTFAGVVVGPALFTLIYEEIGSFHRTFVAMSLFVALGLAALAAALIAGRRERQVAAVPTDRGAGPGL